MTHRSKPNNVVIHGLVSVKNNKPSEDVVKQTALMFFMIKA